MLKIGLLSDTHGYLDPKILITLKIAMNYGMRVILEVQRWPMHWRNSNLSKQYMATLMTKPSKQDILKIYFSSVKRLTFG